jgi:histidyl-tRNA synthetase
MRRADASGAAAALIIGEDEIAAGMVGVKPLRCESEQLTVAVSDVLSALSPFVRAKRSEQTG